LANLNTSKKLKNLHNNILEFKIHFKSKLFLIQRLDEEDWIKSMYIEYITYSFSTAIGPHVCDSWNITKQKEIEKVMQCPFIKSPPLWYGSGFFLKGRYYYAFIAEKMQKNFFFEWNFIQKF
jgi:hypothetical protein